MAAQVPTRLRVEPEAIESVAVKETTGSMATKEDDFLFANEGDDLLYDSQGINRLLGGDGDDSLYDPNGFLVGGSGSDRLLTHRDARLSDHVAEDIIVEIHSSNWQREKAVAFDTTFRRLGSNIFLRSTPQADRLVIREVPSLNGRLVHNVDGEIHMLDWDPTNHDRTEEVFFQFHRSIAMNWDTEAKLVAFDASFAGRMAEFHALSSWTSEDPQDPNFTKSTIGDWWYRTDSEFSDASGNLHPRLDFVSTWELVYAMHDRPFDHVIPKLTWVSDLFNDLRNT